MLKALALLALAISAASSSSDGCGGKPKSSMQGPEWLR